MREDREDGFARGALDAPDGEPTQPDPDVMRVAGETPTSATGGRVGELKAQGQNKSEDALDKRLTIVQQARVGGFVVKIDGDGPIGAGPVCGVSHGSPSGQMVGATDDPRWG